MAAGLPFDSQESSSSSSSSFTAAEHRRDLFLNSPRRRGSSEPSTGEATGSRCRSSSSCCRAHPLTCRRHFCSSGLTHARRNAQPRLLSLKTASSSGASSSLHLHQRRHANSTDIPEEIKPLTLPINSPAVRTSPLLSASHVGWMQHHHHQPLRPSPPVFGSQ